MKIEDISELVDVMVDSKAHIDIDVCKKKVPNIAWSIYADIVDPFVIDATILQKEKVIYVTIGDYDDLKCSNIRNNVKNKTVEFKYIGVELRMEYKDITTLEFIMIALGIKRDMATIATYE